MRRLAVVICILGATLVGCQGLASPTVIVPGRDAPFPATWTPTPLGEATSTATLVVQPTPTWDGTPPPPSEAYVPRVLPGQLYRALKDEQAITVVDVRSLAAYEQAHITGAVHVPLEELGERAGELDGNTRIVFYCLSPNEAMSLQAAMILYRLGFTDIAVLEGGIQKWYSDGYPIEGTILTPTPRFIGPPWTVTPLPTTVASPAAADTSTPMPRVLTATAAATATKTTQ